jgi:signal transduction histidine kinase
MRLRHKLTLGLGLVVASVALLAGGVALAYVSYQEAGRSTKRKLDEIAWIIKLRDAIQAVSAYQLDQSADAEMTHLLTTLDLVGRQKATIRYEFESFTVPRNLDPDNCEEELARLDRIDESHRLLLAAVRGTGNSFESAKRIIDRADVRPHYDRLCRIGTELFDVSKADVAQMFSRADQSHRRSLMIAGFATTLAIVLILALLYYFRVWVFAPIRQIQAGVQRVHAGDFDQPIRLRSKDELEELADEFNGMTVRLRDIYKDLARQVDERSRQLVRSERLVSVGFLAAGVSHEINNPLASIAFCAEALERRVADLARSSPDDAEVLTKYLRMIQQEAFRCKEITLKLLDFSRTGGQRETTDLGPLITDVVEMARHLPNARAKTIRFSPERAVYAPVNGRDVKSVVLNLTVNALDSMDDGGTLTIRLGESDGQAHLTFTDTGCGMAKEVLDNIFEPFFTRNRTGNGTGLGLSISHQIIHQHGGSIAASSAGPGQGSTFAVRLPAMAAATDDEPTVLAFPQRRAAA